ncbi:MAG: hypothetical protein ACI9ZT_001311 [Gammaproteobacteria bacterium]|jgi:hypothetical protein
MKNLHLLGLALALSVAGCGDDDKSATSKSMDKVTEIITNTTESASESVIKVVEEAATETSTAVVTKAASAGTLEPYDPDVPSMVLEDNGAIQQEAIYKQWPE